MRGNKHDDRYKPLMKLGRGGMGVVHLAATHGPNGFGRLVVLKQLRPDLVKDKVARRMFMEEARISARLTHPNIVQVFEVAEHDGVPTIVMEYLDGQPLTAFTAPALLPRDLRILVLTKVLTALDACHDLKDYDNTPLNLIHRDVSPHNIFVLFDGQVKLLDFGIAKAHGSEVHTRIGELKGKIRYMAPEQMFANQQDRRVDVFTVGILLFEALTDSRLWETRKDGDILAALIRGEIVDPDRLVDVPSPLRRACLTALSASPGDRFATAREFKAVLDGWLESRADCSEHHLARFMRKEFGEDRDRRHRMVQRAMRNSGNDSTLPPPATPLPSAAAKTLRPRPVSRDEQTVFSTRIQRARRRRWLVGSSLVALVLASVAIAFILTRSSNRAPESPSDPVGCAHHEKACGEQCVSLDQPRYGCAAEGCRACDVPHATPRCSRDGNCDIAVCHEGYGNCDGAPSNGCETNVRIDPDHCGSCNHACPSLPHAERGCGNECTIGRCQHGYRDCNGEVEDGCEVDVRDLPDGKCPT